MFHVHLNSAPKFIDPSAAYQKIKVFHGFTLECELEQCEPEPSITWYKVY